MINHKVFVTLKLICVAIANINGRGNTSQESESNISTRFIGYEMMASPPIIRTDFLYLSSWSGNVVPNSNDSTTRFQVYKYGITLTANFSEMSPLIPQGYMTTILAIAISAVVLTCGYLEVSPIYVNTTATNKFL
jgi:hypothetical protein